MRISSPVPRFAAVVSLLALCSCEPSSQAPPPMPPQQPLPALPPPMPPPLPAEAPPTGRLPADTRPTHYRLSLTAMPQQPRFAGSVDIDITLDRPRDVIWLHGRGLTVQQVALRAQGAAPIAARWEQATPAGVAAVRLPFPVGPGNIALHIDYDAPFSANGDGFTHVHRDGKSYGFTQFESIFARQAFPCFDEPAFKTPYDVTIFAPQGQEATSNAREIERAPAAAGLTRFTFATTAPLPTYLLAFAVGPLDIVNAPPIPPNAVRKRPLALRGIAASGRGKEFTYALAHTPEILGALEDYFGIEYPYDKLDLIAVPEKGGAMENAGAVTFSEQLLLIDEKNAPENQRWSFASVMAHELAHQWFGYFVTTTWWDDIWLNEAFATWAAQHITRKLYPSFQPDVRGTDDTHFAMGADELTTARQIRQEVKDENDIFNAFDAITYSKGSAVLRMFERSVGPEAFRKGINAYLNKHRFGNATEADLLSAVSIAAGRDVLTPFRTFLFQPGLPLVEASLECTGKPALKLKQSRFLPVGSAGDTRGLWHVPVCARYADGKQIKEACTLLTEREGSLPLDATACPAWVMPNADAAGYYRWTLPPADLKKLSGPGYAKLTAPERMSFAESLRAGFVRGTTPAADVLTALAPFAADPNHAVARAPLDLLGPISQWLEDDAALKKSMEAYGQRLYGPIAQDLGWEPKKGKPEDNDRPLLRRMVLQFLAENAKDPNVRKEAVARGRAYLGIGKDNAIHPEAVSPDLATIALTILGEEADAATFDAALSKLPTVQSEPVRRNLMSLLGATMKPDLAARARGLIIDPKVPIFQTFPVFGLQFGHQETREATWTWFKANLDAVMSRLPPAGRARIVFVGNFFCDKEHAEDFQRAIGPRVMSLEGGPREYANVLEEINLCLARRKAQEASARAFFKKGKQPHHQARRAVIERQKW